MSIWEQLGISQTNDIRQIKKAYAAKSKLVHPEEHPEEFRQLHEAYESALMYAKFKRKQSTDTNSADHPEVQNNFNFSKIMTADKGIQNTDTEDLNQFDFTKIKTVNNNEQNLDTDNQDNQEQFDFSSVKSDTDTESETENTQQAEFDFQKAIYQSNLRRNNQIMEMTEIVLSNAGKLYNSKVFDTELQWLDVFNNDLVDQIINEPIFINELTSFLKTHKMNENMANALFKVFHLVDLIGIKDKGIMGELFNIVVNAKGEAFNRLEMKIKLSTYFMAISIIMAIVFFALNMYPMCAVMFFVFPVLLAVVIILKERKKKFYV